MRTALLLLLCLMMLPATGCMRELPEPPRKEYPRPATGGKRIILEGASGHEDLKLRKRHKGFKVYGEDHLPLGLVRWREEGPRGTFVELRTLDGSRRAILASLAKEGVPDETTFEDTFDVGDRLRMERIERGWAIFDRQGTLLALLDRDGEERWRMRKSYNDRDSWTVTRGEDRMQLRLGDQTVRTFPAALFATVGILAFGIASLDPLDTVALATWLSLHFAES